MKVAVLGTPCGGTGYAHALLRAHGLDVGHEEERADGLVCGVSALARRRVKPRAPEAVLPLPNAARTADTVIRLIRDPLDVAVTLPGVGGVSTSPTGEEIRAIRRSREYMAAWAAAVSVVGRVREDGSTVQWYEAAPRQSGRAPEFRADELVRLALRLWVETHEAIPGNAPVLRLASIDEDWPAVARRLGVEPRPVRIRYGSKGWRWPRWTWERWAAEDPATCARGRALWERYGEPARSGEASRARG